MDRLNQRKEQIMSNLANASYFLDPNLKGKLLSDSERRSVFMYLDKKAQLDGLEKGLVSYVF